jgi:hypothetical protein
VSFTEQRRYQDIAIFNIRDDSTPRQKKSNPLVTIAVTVAVTLIVVAAAYWAGWRAGIFAAPCCIGSLDFQIELDG